MSGITIIPQLEKAKQAARIINGLPNETRISLMAAIADTLLLYTDEIVEANQKDLDAMDRENPLYDRLKLNRERISDIADAVCSLANLKDPAGKKLSSLQRENGLLIEKITVPLGVVGAIYEARPNVTVDISALCLRSGNAVVLKGGSDAFHSNAELVRLIQNVLKNHSLPPEAITLLPPDREVVQELLTATNYVDVLIPRGSQGLINFVRQHATVPTIETGAGVCHTYVHAEADWQKAAAIVVNAKTQRPSVCNALDTILVDRDVPIDFYAQIMEGFLLFSVEIFADEDACQHLKTLQYPFLQKALPEHFGQEFLSQKCAIKTVNSPEEALEHIAVYSSRHSEAIITENQTIAENFLKQVDAAAVYHNASTRFTDGGAFGLGAELGISTQKLHARGPFALEKLVCEKWVVRGNGQVRF